MQNYRFICTALALHITVANFAGHKRTHPDDPESSKSTKRKRVEPVQRDSSREMLAAEQKNQWQVAHNLLRLSANTEAKKNMGISSFFIAALSGHHKVIKIFIQNGAPLIPNEKIVRAPLELYYSFQKRKHKTVLTTPFLQYLIKASLDATADNGDTILHHLLFPTINDSSLLFHILHHPSFTAFNAEHKNMFGYNALHICADKNPDLLQALHNALTLGKTPEEIKRLKKATTPCGDTMKSLKSQPNASPHNSWTPLMHTASSIHSLTDQSIAQLKQRLRNTDDPAYVTDEYDSALSVAQHRGVKYMIRKAIQQKRRAQVFAYLIDEHRQTHALANLQLQFAGTYEPSQ